MGVPSKLVISFWMLTLLKSAHFLSAPKRRATWITRRLNKPVFTVDRGQGFFDRLRSHVFDFVENFHQPVGTHAAHGLHENAVGVMLNNDAASQFVR